MIRSLVGHRRSIRHGMCLIRVDMLKGRLSRCVLRVRCHLLGRVVSRQRRVRGLANHTISTAIRLRHALLISREVGVRGAHPRTAMMRCWCREGRLSYWSLRHKGLCLGVKRRVPIITARDRMLALWVVGIEVGG